MLEKKLKAIIFDADGVLFDSVEADIQHQYSWGDERNKNDIHKGIIKHHFHVPQLEHTAHERQSRINNTQAFNDGMLLHNPALFPNITILLTMIRQSRFPAAIISNGTTDYLDSVLKNSLTPKQITETFSLGVIGVDQHEIHKAKRLKWLCDTHSLALEEVIYIADTRNDFHAMVGTQTLQPDQFYVSTYGGIHGAQHWQDLMDNPIPESNFLHSPSQLVTLFQALLARAIIL